MPTLTKKIRSTVESNQIKTINAKLIQGLNQLSILDGGLTKDYETTEEFVQALSKHMKITKICSTSDLKDCMGYDKIYYENEGSVDSEELSALTKAKYLSLGDGFLPPAGFVTADGTSYIVSWNKDCTKLPNSGVEDGKVLKDIPASCFDGLFDINGHTRPNKFNEDIQTMGSAKMGFCVAHAGEYCVITKAIVSDTPTALTCEEQETQLGVQNCCTNCYLPPSIKGDFWAAGLEYCKSKGGHMPDATELTDIVRKICGNNSIDVGKALTCYKDENILRKLGLLEYLSNSKTLVLWSSTEKEDDSVRVLYYGITGGVYTNYTQKYIGGNTICVSD